MVAYRVFHPAIRAQLVVIAQASWHFQRSKNPDPPGRLDMKYNVEPSAERFGLSSKKMLLTFAPRLAAAPKASEGPPRTATQMSKLPSPPLRSDPMNRVKPSCE